MAKDQEEKDSKFLKPWTPSTAKTAMVHILSREDLFTSLFLWDAYTPRERRARLRKLGCFDSLVRRSREIAAEHKSHFPPLPEEAVTEQSIKRQHPAEWIRYMGYLLGFIESTQGTTKPKEEKGEEEEESKTMTKEQYCEAKKTRRKTKRGRRRRRKNAAKREKQQQPEKTKKKKKQPLRLFSLTPQFTPKMYFVGLNAETLAALFFCHSQRAADDAKKKKKTPGEAARHALLGDWFPDRFCLSNPKLSQSEFFAKALRDYGLTEVFRHLFNLRARSDGADVSWGAGLRNNNLLNCKLLKHGHQISSVTTDGFNARVMMEAPLDTQAKKKKKGGSSPKTMEQLLDEEEDGVKGKLPPVITSAELLAAPANKRVIYTHGHDRTVVVDDTHVLVTVDPGRATPVTAAVHIPAVYHRQVTSADTCSRNSPRPDGGHGTHAGKRRRRLLRCAKQRENDVYRFKMTKGEWNSWTHKTQTDQQRLAHLSPEWSEVNRAMPSPKTTSPTQAAARAAHHFQHWGLLFAAAHSAYRRHHRLVRFNHTRRAFKKIVTRLRRVVRRALGPHNLTAGERTQLSRKMVIVWGNGGFKPSGTGHQSAPNRKLREGLLPMVPIVMSTEFNTSRRSPCCHDKVHHGSKGHGPSDSKKSLRGLFYCDKCNTPWDRDFAAALNIGTLYKHRTHSKGLPQAFKR